MFNNTYIASKEVEHLLMTNKAAYKAWKKADGMFTGGCICIGIGGGLVLGGIFPLIYGQSTACIGIECSALVPLGIGLGLTLGASAHYNKAIDIYNSKFDHAAIFVHTGTGKHIIVPEFLGHMPLAYYFAI